MLPFSPRLSHPGGLPKTSLLFAVVPTAFVFSLAVVVLPEAISDVHSERVTNLQVVSNSCSKTHAPFSFDLASKIQATSFAVSEFQLVSKP